MDTTNKQAKTCHKKIADKKIEINYTETQNNETEIENTDIPEKETSDVDTLETKASDTDIPDNETGISYTCTLANETENSDKYSSGKLIDIGNKDNSLRPKATSKKLTLVQCSETNDILISHRETRHNQTLVKQPESGKQKITSDVTEVEDKHITMPPLCPNTDFEFNQSSKGGLCYITRENIKTVDNDDYDNDDDDNDDDDDDDDALAYDVTIKSMILSSMCDPIEDIDDDAILETYGSEDITYLPSNKHQPPMCDPIQDMDDDAILETYGSEDMTYLPSTKHQPLPKLEECSHNVDYLTPTKYQSTPKLQESPPQKIITITNDITYCITNTLTQVKDCDSEPHYGHSSGISDIIKIIDQLRDKYRETLDEESKVATNTISHSSGIDPCNHKVDAFNCRSDYEQSSKFDKIKSGKGPQFCMSDSSVGLQAQITDSGIGSLPQMTDSGIGPLPEMTDSGMGPLLEMTDNGLSNQSQMLDSGVGPQPQLIDIGVDQEFFYLTERAIQTSHLIQPLYKMMKDVACQTDNLMSTMCIQTTQTDNNKQICCIKIQTHSTGHIISSRFYED